MTMRPPPPTRVPTLTEVVALPEVQPSAAVVAPPVPPFYARPATLDDMVREMAARVLGWLGVDPGDALTRWQGL